MAQNLQSENFKPIEALATWLLVFLEGLGLHAPAQ